MILSVAQLKAALASLGGGEDEETIQFHKGPGHSGEGIYASTAEYPDEGSVFLGPQA
jgi:hypothetical protein